MLQVACFHIAMFNEKAGLPLRLRNKKSPDKCSLHTNLSGLSLFSARLCFKQTVSY
ncbi:hypothetical protein PI172_1265 [Prevotella intermedia]|uniref:Uncharacterized protein n=1 Tax=Prevotella intermedia TaxID=28131 RepID=A0AAD1BIH7_PREIN|nr:hypothetical protein PIN17_A1418 [Prevotella intermedia 17]BAR95993.1 hypothetical protein PI172_1265 [Prevotella intermedia]